MRKAALPLLISFFVLPSTTFANNGRVWDDTAYYNNVAQTAPVVNNHGNVSQSVSQNALHYDNAQPAPPSDQQYGQQYGQNVQRVSDTSLYETNPEPESRTEPTTLVQPQQSWNASYTATGSWSASYTATGSWSDQALSQARSVGDWAEANVLNTSNELDGKIAQAAADGKPYLIWVNIPSYTLRVYDTSTRELLLSSKVIVGATGSQTPIFDTNVINLKYNPDWSPPASLKRKGKRYVPPGPNNPLGQVRFSTDNNRSIYLHDTNHHELFDREARALSAGCVRVSRWNELAQILSGEDEQSVTNHTAGNRIKFVEIPTSLVWISYQRLDLNEGGQLVVYPDIYRKQTLPVH